MPKLLNTSANLRNSTPLERSATSIASASSAPSHLRRLLDARRRGGVDRAAVDANGRGGAARIAAARVDAYRPQPARPGVDRGRCRGLPDRLDSVGRDADVKRRSARDAGTQRQASAAMLAGHFAHVPFRPRTSSAPAAKAIYPREGGWLYVIVGPGKDALDIAVVRGARRTTVATIAAATETRAVFVAVRDRIDGVQLLDGDAAVASARIAY